MANDSNATLGFMSTHPVAQLNPLPNGCMENCIDDLDVCFCLLGTESVCPRTWSRASRGILWENTETQWWAGNISHEYRELHKRKLIYNLYLLVIISFWYIIKTKIAQFNLLKLFNLLRDAIATYSLLTTLRLSRFDLSQTCKRSRSAFNLSSIMFMSLLL